jgi:hypothetical protein
MLVSGSLFNSVALDIKVMLVATANENMILMMKLQAALAAVGAGAQPRCALHIATCSHPTQKTLTPSLPLLPPMQVRMTSQNGMLVIWQDYTHLFTELLRG